LKLEHGHNKQKTMMNSFYSTSVKRLCPRPLLSRSPQRVLWRGASDSKMPPENGEYESLNQQILEALKTQNQLLTSIDARLGRIEQQPSSMAVGRQSTRRQHPTAQLNPGSWRFVESDGAKAAKPSKSQPDYYQDYMLCGSIVQAVLYCRTGEQNRADAQAELHFLVQ